jgi:hypothetical protein
MTEPLSPAAQAVLDAVREICPAPADEIAAAALRAAADQVVPVESHPEKSQFWDDEAEQEWQTKQAFRRNLLAIAAELEGTK